MITPDIRKFLTNSRNETMKIVLYFEMSKNDVAIRVIYPGSSVFVPVDLSLSYKYAIEPDLLCQFSLAICLKLYSVADSLRFYKTFYKVHLKPISRPNFTVSNVTKSVFHRELYVPIKPNV